jgi:hypothetical protein
MSNSFLGESLGFTRNRLVISLILMGATTISPGEVLAGFDTDFFGLTRSDTSLMLVPAIGCMIAGFIIHPNIKKYALLGMLSGLIIGLCVFYATGYYLEGKESYIKIEMILPMIIGAAPGATLYYWLYQKIQ